MNYNIKKANISNLEEIYNLQQGYQHFLISKDNLKNDLKNDLCIYFIAIDDNQNIIGTIGSSILVDHADISIVITQNSLTKKGIASSLLNKLIEYCKITNIDKIFLEVRESNTPALKLYEKFNFKQISIRKNYYTDNKENALIYMLEI